MPVSDEDRVVSENYGHWCGHLSIMGTVVRDVDSRQWRELWSVYEKCHQAWGLLWSEVALWSVEPTAVSGVYCCNGGDCCQL